MKWKLEVYGDDRDNSQYCGPRLLVYLYIVGGSSRAQNHVGDYCGPTVLNRFKGTVLVRRAYDLGFQVWGTFWDAG